MKKLLILSAIALLGLASCKKEEIKPEVKPTPSTPRREIIIRYVPGGLR